MRMITQLKIQRRRKGSAGCSARGRAAVRIIAATGSIQAKRPKARLARFIQPAPIPAKNSIVCSFPAPQERLHRHRSSMV